MYIFNSDFGSFYRLFGDVCWERGETRKREKRASAAFSPLPLAVLPDTWNLYFHFWLHWLIQGDWGTQITPYSSLCRYLHPVLCRFWLVLSIFIWRFRITIYPFWALILVVGHHFLEFVLSFAAGGLLLAEHRFGIGSCLNRYILRYFQI